VRCRPERSEPFAPSGQAPRAPSKGRRVLAMLRWSFDYAPGGASLKMTISRRFA
jgi:hypothetical protein